MAIRHIITHFSAEAPIIHITGERSVCKYEARTRFEKRLFRIFEEAGVSPIQILTVTPEEMVDIPGITVPNIRAVLCVQNKVLSEKNTVRSGKAVAALLREVEKEAR